MSEWAISNKLPKLKILEILCISIMGWIISGLTHDLFIVFILILMRFILIRSFWESIFLLVSSSYQIFINHENVLFLYALMLGIYLILTGLRLVHLDNLKLMKYLIVLSILIYLGINQYPWISILSISISSLGLMSIYPKDIPFISLTFLPKVCLTIILIATAILLETLIPLGSSLYLMMSFILICSYESKERIIFVYLFLLSLGLDVVMPIYGLIMIASILRKEKFLLTCLTITYFISFGLYPAEAILIIAMLILYWMSDHEKTVLRDDEYVTHNQKALIQRQLISFSQIFENMANYYEHLSISESKMLYAMSDALDMTSRSFIHEENHFIRIIEDILIGYKIDYEQCLIKKDEQGRYIIIVSLYNFRKSEVKEVLLPLFHSILPVKVTLSGIIQNQHIVGLTTYEFCSEQPIKLDISADSCKHSEVSGDCFSVFHHEHICYCLISDGMGYGQQAYQISSCISSMFQKMITAGIDSRKALECINQLLQSDTFATVDLLAFDRIRKTARLSKSAASPTYLIRKNELYSITSHSLPIGIVTKVNVDTIEIEIEADDWFLMSSDGVYMDEIIEWMKVRKNENAREETERFMQILNKKPRKDDSTILLIRVM